MKFIVIVLVLSIFGVSCLAEEQEKPKEQITIKKEESVIKVVTIFTSANCSYCHDAIEYFKEKGIAYIEYSYQGNEQFFRDMGIHSIPHIIVTNGKKEQQVIIGFNKEKIKKALDIKE